MMNPERRVKPRLRPNQITYVAVRPDFHNLGRLLDISSDGLGFQYISNDDPVEDTTFLDIDLFMNQNRFYLQKISCKMIFDTPVDAGILSSKCLMLRRCGLQFQKLTKSERVLLTHFFKDHNKTLD